MITLTGIVSTDRPMALSQLISHGGADLLKRERWKNITHVKQPVFSIVCHG